MKKLLLILFTFSSTLFFAETNTSLFSVITNASGVPIPPQMIDLPSLEVVSSILTESNDLEDIKNEFSNVKEYDGDRVYFPPENYVGVWWRFYTQTSSLFQLPAISEEILSIDDEGKVLWLQDIKSAKTIHSTSKRKLTTSYFLLFGKAFLVFHYNNQDPLDQEVRENQGFFVRILSDRSYMQMSTSPNFEPENSMYWRRFPLATVEKQVDVTVELDNTVNQSTEL